MPNMPKGPQINVEVTEEIIEHSIARDSRHCMIANAIKAGFPVAKSIAVDLQTVRFTDPERQLRYSYMTPRIAQVQLVKFDQGIKPDPFNFKLRQAHVTRAGTASVRQQKLLTPEEKEERKKRTEKMREVLRVSRLTNRGDVSLVPDRVGGKTAPLQHTSDGAPFTRRRAFGLRALEL